MGDESVLNWLQQSVSGSGEGLLSSLRLQSKSRHVGEGQLKNLGSKRRIKEERSIIKHMDSCFPHVSHMFSIYFFIL